MRFRRSAGQNTRDRACAVGCRTRGRTRPGPRAFRAKAACRTAASWVKWQAEVELDRMTFAVFPGPTPGGGGTGLCRGSGPVGLGPWGALGPPCPPTGALPPPGAPQAIDNLPRSSWTGRGRVGQDDVRGVPGPQTRGGRRRPRQGVRPGGSGALGPPGTAPTAHQTAGPGRHPGPIFPLSRPLARPGGSWTG